MKYDIPTSGPAHDIETRLSVQRAIQELTIRDRRIIILRFFEELTFAEIGSVLGISGSAARSAYVSAANKLRIKLENKGFRKKF
jgi:RNA polymerase sigma factor (sigma-70 family)